MTPRAALEKTGEATEASIELWVGRKIACGEHDDVRHARSAFWREMRSRKDSARSSHHMDLITALIQLAHSVRNHGDDLVLAGGFAYGVHAEPRATVDIDVVVVRATDAEALEAAMRDVFESVYVNQETMEYTRVRVRRYLGITGTEETIVDMIEPREARLAERVRERAERVEFHGAPVFVISREDLYLLKAGSAREQDGLDAKRLAEAPDFDWNYVNDMEQLLK